MTELEMPWRTEETKDRLVLCHDHRWLRIIGFPAIGLGTVIALGIWFIPGINLNEAWPMLMVGSLIGSACILMGLQLSFSVINFSVQRGASEILRREGFGPFVRTQSFRIDDNSVVKVSVQADPGMMSGYILEIQTADQGLRIAKFPDPSPIELEGKRWARFLQLPLKITGY